MRAPLSGFLGPYSSRVAIRPGISVSASEISLRPNSASVMSLTMKSPARVFGFAEAVITIPGSYGGLAGELTWLGVPITARRQPRNAYIKIALCREKGNLVFLAESIGHQFGQRIDCDGGILADGLDDDVRARASG